MVIQHRRIRVRADAAALDLDAAEPDIFITLLGRESRREHHRVGVEHIVEKTGSTLAHSLLLHYLCIEPEVELGGIRQLVGYVVLEIEHILLEVVVEYIVGRSLGYTCVMVEVQGHIISGLVTSSLDIDIGPLIEVEVTEKKLSEVLKPNSFELVRKLSKALVFSSPKETITIYLVFEIESYVAVIKSRRKVSVKLLSQYSGKKYPIGTHKLFDLLKKRHMISPSFEEYQPKYYDPLDFDELACRLEGFLEPDVSLVVNHRLPSAEELDGKHTTWYDDGTVFSPVTIDVINMSDECYLILVMFKYELKETFDILISDHKFEDHRPSFSGADIIEDLLYED